jgi:prevent-host-death family protein
MQEASFAEVQRDFGAYREIAEAEPVTVVHGSRPAVVIVSADEYARLKRRDKQVMLTKDLPEWIVDRIAVGEMDPQFAALDELAEQEGSQARS